MTAQVITDALAGAAQGMNPFRPVAYYDEHMDAIYVEWRDCSLLESRVNGWLTILRDNHPEAKQRACVGVAVKGVKHLFNEIGWSESGVYRVVDFINKILEKHRDELSEQELREVRRFLDFVYNSELSINFSPV